VVTYHQGREHQGGRRPSIGLTGGPPIASRPRVERLVDLAACLDPVEILKLADGFFRLRSEDPVEGPRSKPFFLERLDLPNSVLVEIWHCFHVQLSGILCRRRLDLSGLIQLSQLGRCGRAAMAVRDAVAMAAMARFM
jgi:hypothetical protein